MEREKKSRFQKVMEWVTLLSIGVALLFFLLWKVGNPSLWFPFFLTVVTIGYHFGMRLLVGAVFEGLVKRLFHPENPWFRSKKWERKLYRRLKVKRWKSWVPTYSPAQFCLQDHTVDEIVQTMCRAELIHEIIALLSYGSLLFGLLSEDPADFWIFFSTAVVASGFDCMFVMVQRFNRPRLLALKKRL
jgi:hypothetical protein